MNRWLKQSVVGGCFLLRATSLLVLLVSQLAGGVLHGAVIPQKAGEDGRVAPGAKLVRVRTEDDKILRSLDQYGFDVWEVNERGALVYLPDEQEAARFSEFGLSFEILDLLTRADVSAAAVDGYYTFDEYESDLQAWAASHPDRVRLTSLGTSREGRQIWLLKLSDNVAVDEDEPGVLLLALQHAREWLAGMTVHGVVRHFVESYGADSAVTELTNALEIHVVLVCNPDGYVYTHTTDRMWRKNRRDNGDGSFGVDLNRNFPFYWTAGSATPGSTTYRGPSPLSEPENVAIDSWVRARGTSLKGCLNFHTYGAKIMHNWAWTTVLPPNVETMGSVARAMALDMEDVTGQRYRNGSWSRLLSYTGSGTTVDYFHADLGLPTLTLELRPGEGDSGGFTPTGASIAPSIAENIPGVVSFLRWVQQQAGASGVPPVLSGVTLSKLSDSQVTVSWMTDQPCIRGVETGTSSTTAIETRPDRLRGLVHAVMVTGLTPSTAYVLRARAENLNGISALSAWTPFTTAATPQDITPPAPPVLQVVRRSGSGAIEVRWNASPSSDIAGYRLYQKHIDGSVSLLLGEATLGAGSRTATLGAQSAGELHRFFMTAVDLAAAPNESIASDVYAARLGAQPAGVLVVDGFDRWASSEGVNHAFAADHGMALDANGVSFDTCANEALGPLVVLPTYRSVFWVLGDESTADETFSAAEQNLVKTFLEEGGNLLVSGAEVAWDLDRPSGPVQADRDFLNVYLCADFSLDSTIEWDVSGAGAASLFSSRLMRFDDGSRGLYPVRSPDAVLAMSGGITSVRTPKGRTVGVQKHGVFGAGISPGRLVYLCFPLETVFDEPQRAEVMGDILTFFGEKGNMADVSEWLQY